MWLDFNIQISQKYTKKVVYNILLVRKRSQPFATAIGTLIITFSAKPTS
jgi:hypothetical protein